MKIKMKTNFSCVATAVKQVERDKEDFMRCNKAVRMTGDGRGRHEQDKVEMKARQLFRGSKSEREAERRESFTSDLLLITD